MKKIFIITLLVFITIANYTHASKDPYPFATQENIYGIWEAIDLQQVYRVFRLELNREGTSIITEGMPNKTYIKSFAAYLTDMNLNNGKIILKFQSMDKRLIGIESIEDGKKYVSTGESIIEGIARVCSRSGVTSGTMDVKFILEPNSPSPRIWKLRFYKLQNRTLVEDIIQMEKFAADAAVKAKKEIANKIIEPKKDVK